MFPAPQTYFPSYSRTSIIYLSCIVAVVVGIALLPYLKTDISIHSAALIYEKITSLPKDWNFSITKVIHANNYFWRTHDRQEIDWVEERMVRPFS